MNLSKKILPVTMAILLTGFLGGCSEKDPVKPVASASTSADVAVKEAYIKLWSDSYNFDALITADVKFDESALIGTKGGLTQQQAEEELEILEKLQEPNSQNMLNMLAGGKLTIKGAYDANNYKTENIVGVNFNQNGMQVSLDVPTLFDLKNDPTVFIDPKAAKALGFLPPQLDGKLVKLSVSDIPMLTDKQRASLKAGSPLLQKIKELIISCSQDTDANLFKEIAVSDAAKAAGAVRMVELTMTPEQNNKQSNEATAKFIDIVVAEFDLPTDQAGEMKERIIKSNKESMPFMGNSVSTFWLNDNGQIVYMIMSMPFKGAKHAGTVSIAFTIKDFGKPTFTIDSAKQSTVGFAELMFGM